MMDPMDQIHQLERGHMTPNNPEMLPCPECSDLEEDLIVYCLRPENMVVGNSYKLRDGRTAVYLARWGENYLFGTNVKTTFYDTKNLHGIKALDIPNYTRPDPSQGKVDVELTAINLWHRFAPDSHEVWEDEPEKEIYRMAARECFATRYDIKEK